MSTDYSFGVAVGFEIEFEAIFEKWGRTLSEKFHMEERFCPKTGKKLAQEKIVDRVTQSGLAIAGKEITLEDRHNIDEALDKEIGAYVQWTNDNPGRIRPMETVMVSLKGKKIRDPSILELDYGRVTASGGFLVEDLIKALPELRKLKARLRKLGFKPGKPIVRIVGGYG